MWYWISLPYATFAIECEKGLVKKTAPIASWSTGKGEQFVVEYYKRKGAKVIAIRHNIR
jgi:hypothetical protein